VTVSWSRKAGPGAPLQFRAAHGLWQISAPDPREASMELGYVRQDARGRLPGVPLPIGVFSSAAEAMLAVELYEAALAGGQVPGVPIGKGGVARVLAKGSDLVIEKTEADLLLVGERPDGVRSTIARLHRPRPRGGALVHKSDGGRGAAATAAFQAVRCDTGMPSLVIRLSTEQATRASVF
jgi:hypothetical protein